MKVLAWSGEGPLRGCRLLVVSSQGRRGQGSLRPLLKGHYNPIHEGSALNDLITWQRLHLLIPSPWGLGFNI